MASFKLLGFGLAAALATLAPQLARAELRHGGDDTQPEDVSGEAQPLDDKGGLRVAKHGADDLGPEHPIPEVGDDKGTVLARHGGDDTQPEDVSGEIEAGDDKGATFARHGGDDTQPEDVSGEIEAGDDKGGLFV